jgi:hypothetical protein
VAVLEELHDLDDAAVGDGGDVEDRLDLPVARHEA